HSSKRAGLAGGYAGDPPPDLSGPCAAIIPVPRGVGVHPADLKKILERVRHGKVSPEKALRRLRTLPYEDPGFAKGANHRHLRRRFPEVIFGEGKTIPQIIAIMGKVASRRQPVLVTRVPVEVYRKVRRRYKGARYHAQARAITLESPRKAASRPGI